MNDYLIYDLETNKRSVSPLQNQQQQFANSGNQQHNARVEQVKQELYNQNIEMNEKVLQREEQVLRLESELKLLKNENDAITEEKNKLAAKNKALQLYSSELQHSIDNLNELISTKTRTLNEYESLDWTKKLHENAIELKNLRHLLSQKDAEVHLLRKNLSSYFTNPRDSSQSLFLEHQAKELASSKKQIIEFENRSNECSKRWTQLLKENSDKDDKIKGLKLQLNRSVETMQALYSDHDRKINEYNSRLMRVFEEQRNRNDAQSDAAGFLVEQVALMQEERKNLAVENEQLHSQIQELISEIEKMRIELENYACLFDVSVLDLSSNRNNTGNIIAKLKSRVEELEDFINEAKQKDSVGRLMELTDLNEELEKNLDKERIINDEISKTLSTLQASNSTKADHINEQTCIDFFSSLLEEKDKRISQLIQQHEQLLGKEKTYNERIDDLTGNLLLANKNFTEYKTKNDKIGEIVANQNRQNHHSPIMSSGQSAQFGKLTGNAASIISNERVSEKIYSDARIDKRSFNEYHH